MRANVLALLSASVLVAAGPQPARFDQRQTGTYNLHLNLKDGQVFALANNGLVSVPVRNFAVTLKGPLAPPTTESPRTDGRTDGRTGNEPPVKPSFGILQNLKDASIEFTKIPDTEKPVKTPTAETYPNLKISNTDPVKTSNTQYSPGKPTSGQLITSNGTSNNRRQNNKVSSHIANQQTAELAALPPPPPPSPAQAAKPTLSPLPPLPPSIIAALTDQRASQQHIGAVPDEINEIDRIKTFVLY